MRLVDLLLSPRQQSYGVSTNESQYRHPLGAAYLRSKNSEELKSNRKNQDFHRRQDSILSQPTSEKSFRSTGSLSDLLRSKKSPTSPGYWNHSSVNPSSSSSSSSEALRFAQLSAADQKSQSINGFVKQESDDPPGFTTTRGCFDVCSDDRQPFMTMDKTLNGNIWNREEMSSSSSSSSRFFPSLSSSPSSSLSSLGLDDRTLFNRRRVSLLSSDGSELEPEQILSLATDSDGYESLSSPLEAVDAAAAAAAGTFRWTEHAPDSLVGYLDWHSGGGGGGSGGEGDAERSGYDIDACPLFNFNFLENTLDDCPFESFDTKDTIQRYDNYSFCDSPMVSMVPDVMATEALKNCGSFSDRDDTRGSFRDHVFKLNELERRTTRHGMKTNDGSELSDYPSSASVTAVTGIPVAPVSSMETLQQSEVVKLLLQNRHQWAVPQEKVSSPPVGCRGSRKRSSVTNGRDAGRTKVPREARPSNDGPSNDEISLSFAPSVRTNSYAASGVVGDQDRYDQSSSLEKLITELMLFESTKSDSETDPSMADVRRISSETSANSLPYVELFAPSLRPSDLFDGLATCRISDTELFSGLDLESVYLSDCEPLCTLGEGLDFENVKSFEAFVKTEPEKAPFLSLPPSPSSLCHPDSFGRPGNWLSGDDDVANRSSSRHNDNCPTGADRNKSSVLERILQTNLLFDSLNCGDSKLASREGFISDHDYCQNLDILSLDNGALDLTCCDQSLRLEKRRRCTTEATAPACYQRKRDYSALKSLLLDSNLTEEVKKEVELDRAKSRKKMSEKLKVTSVIDPAVRLQRLGKIRDDRILKQHLENCDPYCGGDNFEDRANSEKNDRNCDEEKRAFDDQNIAYYSPTAEISRLDYDSGTAQPEVLLLSAENSDSGVDSTLVTSDLELSGSDDAVFFNSFEDFYGKNQSEIELSTHQSDADNFGENDEDYTMQRSGGDSPKEFEPKAKRNRRKHPISKRVLVCRSLGRRSVSAAIAKRSPTRTSRALIRTGKKGRSADHRRSRPLKST